MVYCIGTQCATDKTRACNRDAGTFVAGSSSGVQKLEYSGATDTCDVWRMTTSPSQSEWYSLGKYSDFTFKSGCPGIDLSPTNGVCPASNFPTTVGAVVPYADAVDAISPEVKQQPVHPQIIADLANKSWAAAASQPGYAGVPFDAANPITVADVVAWQTAHPTDYPTFGELFTPQPAPSGGTASTPFLLPSSTSPLPESDPTAPPTTTNPAADNPLTNLGPDPNIGMPTLEPIPTVPMILDPIFGMLPGFRSFSVSSHSAVCPTGSISLFNQVHALNAHCDLLESVRNVIAVVMAFVWSFAALRISLSA